MGPLSNLAPGDVVIVDFPVRAIDRQRLRAYVGALTPAQYAPIHAAIAAALPSA